MRHLSFSQFITKYFYYFCKPEITSRSVRIFNNHINRITTRDDISDFRGGNPPGGVYVGVRPRPLKEGYTDLRIRASISIGKGGILGQVRSSYGHQEAMALRHFNPRCSEAAENDGLVLSFRMPGRSTPSFE